MKPRMPAVVWVVTLLICAYGVVLAIEGVVLFVDFLHGGTSGTPNPSRLEAFGMERFAGFLVVVGALLEFAAVRLVRSRRSALFVVPLAILVVGGTIGESFDILGGTGIVSNVIGAGIIILAALPIVLIFTPRARAWKSQ
jgi:hypothetical protein